MSGITRSIPGISSSGNIRPASITSRSPADSTAIMFNPISPRPPRGMIRTDRPSDTVLVLRCDRSKVQVTRGGDSAPGAQGNLGPAPRPCPLGQGDIQYLVHMVHENELHPPFDIGGELFEILVVPGRHDDAVNPHPSRRQHLFLYPSDRQDLSAGG